MRLLALLVVSLTASVAAQPAAPLVVGVADDPPFVIEGRDGTWDGLGVHLAREAALVLGREVEFQEVPAEPDSALAALARGDVDVLAAVIASPEAEAQADLTAAYYAASLGTAERPSSGAWETVKRLFSPTFLKIAAGLAVLLLVVGVVAWLFERGEEDEGFREGGPGVWDGFWWAGVTMSTIGYGDLVPKTVGGRVLGLVWMVLSMGVTAALTAAVVSSLGVGGSSSGLRIPDDLRDRGVGVVDGSYAEAALREHGVDATSVPRLGAGLDAVRNDSLDVMVASAPLLRSATGTRGLDLRVESTPLRAQRWVLAVADGSPLREPVSRAVLDRIGGPDWRAAVERFVPERP